MSMHHVERAAVLDLMATRKLVFMAICDAADKDSGLAFPGFDTLQQWSGAGKSQVHAHIADLIADGYIERVESGRRGRRAVFRVWAKVACCDLHEPLGQPSGQPDPNRQYLDSGQPDPISQLGSGKGSGIGSGTSPAQTGPLPSIQASKHSLVIASDDGETDAPAKPATRSRSKRTNDELDARFDEFWNAYSHKVGRGGAIKAWRAALRAGGDPDQIIAAAAAFRADCVRSGRPVQYIAHPTTWLNQQRWADTPAAEQPAASVSHLPHARHVEAAPDGLTDEEYAAWYASQRQAGRG